MKVIKLTLVLMLFCQAVIAQKVSPEERAKKHVELLDQKVQLSEDQKTDVYQIMLKSAEEIKALKLSGEKNKEAFKAIKKDQRTAIHEVLDEDQIIALKEVHKQMKTERKEAHQQIKQYHKEHVKPQVQAKRVEFDKLLTEDEKQIIEEARALKPKHKKGERKTLTEQEREELKAKRQEINQMLDPIISAHQTELDAIMVDLKPVFDEAEKQRQEIASEQNVKPRKTHKKSQKAEKKRLYRFLLSK